MAPPAAIADGEQRREDAPIADDGDDAPLNVELNRAFSAMPETIFQTMSTLAAKHQCVKYVLFVAVLRSRRRRWPPTRAALCRSLALSRPTDAPPPQKPKPNTPKKTASDRASPSKRGPSR